MNAPGAVGAPPAVLRLLGLSLLMVLAVVVTTPWAWSLYHDTSWQGIALVVWPLLAPLAVIVGATFVQVRSGRARTTFEAKWAVAGALIAACSSLVLTVMGYLGVFVMVVALPVASGFLALSWVRPGSRWRAATVLLGAGVTPFVAWFAGRGDEYVVEALVSGGVIVGVLVALSVIRRQSLVVG